MEPPSQPPANGARGAHGHLAPTHAGRAPGKGLDRSSTTMHGVAHATLATASQKSAITVRDARYPVGGSSSINCISKEFSPIKCRPLVRSMKFVLEFPRTCTEYKAIE